MKTLKTPDMHCRHCVERIENVFTAEGVQAEISLADRTVTFDDAKTEKARVIALLDMLGFCVEES